MSLSNTPTSENDVSRDDELGARAAQAVADRPKPVDADPWRQAFPHPTPIGLLNDPNGLVQH